MEDLKDKLEELEKHHKNGLVGIFKIIAKKGTFKKFPFALSISLSVVISLLILFLSPNKSFKILESGCDLLMLFFPPLLGFSLGGYALIVGFGNIELLKAAARINAYSIYQTLSAIFALSIIFQIFTTVLSFFINWAIKIDVNGLVNNHNHFAGNVVNVVLIFILLLSVLYSLCLTPYIVTNLFTFSQANNLFLTMKQLEEEKNKKGVGS